MLLAGPTVCRSVDEDHHMEVASVGPHEYAPTATDMPPPYTFAPLELSTLADDAALQLVNVLFEMV